MNEALAKRIVLAVTGRSDTITFEDQKSGLPEEVLIGDREEIDRRYGELRRHNDFGTAAFLAKTTFVQELLEGKR